MLTVHVLGPVEVHDGGRAVNLGGPQQRAVIAHLALDVGRVVSADRLIDRLWGDEPPRTPLGTLQSYISRLRRAVEPDRASSATSGIIVSEAPGYVLRLPPDQVDVHRFRSTADEARRNVTAGSYHAAIERFDDALGLWRGPALAGIGPDEQIQPIVVRLEEERRAVVEDRFDVLLALGRHAELVPELRAAVHEFPLRERLWCQLVLALYRSSRQAEALRAVGNARETLLVELGLDPGPELRELERRILDHDPDLLVAATPTVASSPQPTPVERPAVELVGRSQEWAVLTAALAADSVDHLVLIEGEPGIGKSTVVDALASHASEAGHCIAAGRCVEAGLAPSLWPWIEVVNALVASAPAGVAESHPLRALVEQADDATTRRSIVELAQQFVTLLDELGNGPWLVVLDDLHWADRSTMEMLTFVLDRAGRRPLRVVAAHRPAEMLDGGPFVEALGELARRAATHRVRMSPLEVDDVARLVEIVSGVAPNEDVAQRVQRRTGGNPLFVAELARLAGARGLSDDTVVPDAILDVVRSRLSRLPEGTLAELEVAAVLGERFDLLTAMEASERDADACLDALDPAIVTRILVPDEGGYRFGHALVRDAVLANVSPLRLLRLRRRAAEAILQVRGDGPDHAEPIARHFLAAASIADPVVVARAAVRASDVARWRGALDSADRFAVQALEVLAAAPRTAEASMAEIDALEALAGSMYRKDDPDALDQVLDHIRAASARSGSDAARALELFLTWGPIDEGEDLDVIAERTEAARALAATTTDPYATIVTRYMAASFDFLRGELDAAAADLAAALQAAGTDRPDERPPQVPLVLVPVVAGIVAALRGEIEAARAHAHVRARAWLSRRGEVDPAAESALAFNAALVEALLDDPDEVDGVLRDVPRIDMGGFVVHQTATCDLLAAWAGVRLGRAAQLADAFDALDRLDAGSQRVLGPCMRSFVADACLSCDDERALPLLERAIAEAAARGEQWWSAETLRLLARAHRRFGEASRVEELLAEAATLAGRQGAALLAARIAADRAAHASTTG